MALEQLLQQKGEAEDGHLLLKSAYLLSQIDLVRKVTINGSLLSLVCLTLFGFFSF